MALRRDGEVLFDCRESREILVGRELQEGPDCREPRITTSDRVAAIALQVIQKSQDQVRAEIMQGQLGRRPADIPLREMQEQLERIPVGRDRVAADRPLLAKVVHEKLL